MGRLRVVHKWSCEQLNRSLDVLCPRWTNSQLESRLTTEIQWPDGLGALIQAGAVDREPKDQAGTGYDREELIEHATVRWSLYLVRVDV